MKNFLNEKIIITIAIIITVVVAIVFVVTSIVPKPSVIDTIPTDKTEEVIETSQISINFNQDINEESKPNVSVSISPEEEFDSTWLSNTYKIIPKNQLKNNTEYTVKVFYLKKEINSFSFKTAIFNQLDIQKFGALQSKDDYDYGQALTKLVNEYPFYPNLPIRTQDYVVYYDFEQQKFAITFLKVVNSEEKNLLIKGALVNIKEIGTKDPIKYYTNP